MKKLMSFMLAMLMLLTLAACSGNVPSSAASDDVPTAEPTEEPTPKVGSTVHGQLCNLTVQSVEVVDKIEKAVKQVKYMSVQSGPSGMILSNPITTYLDLTAAKGCSIVKISFSFEYLGKSNGVLNFDKIELDYDNGYIFDRSFMTGHIVPDLNTGVANIENTLEKDLIYNTSFKIDNALSFTGGTGFIYIIVDNAAVNNTDKPLVLNIGIPLTPEKDSEYELFTFDLR